MSLSQPHLRKPASLRLLDSDLMTHLGGPFTNRGLMSMISNAFLMSTYTTLYRRPLSSVSTGSTLRSGTLINQHNVWNTADSPDSSENELNEWWMLKSSSFQIDRRQRNAWHTLITRGLLADGHPELCHFLLDVLACRSLLDHLQKLFSFCLVFSWIGALPLVS